MRYFMISVDTEGDNQWDTTNGISVKNVGYLPRFQKLCEKYGFKPVWLTNYEMAKSGDFVRYFKEKQREDKCEVGMHLHAWYTPPEYDLTRTTDARDYLIEYPEEIMEQKITTMTRLLEDRFEEPVVSHRSGRWAMDDRYFKMLVKYGYKVDCSVTPHINWNDQPGATGIGGTDYSRYQEIPYFTNEGLLEIPVTIRKMHFINREKISSAYSALRELKHAIEGQSQWLRFFDSSSAYGVNKLADKLVRTNDDVLFMIHSSELMPGGSPAFANDEDIAYLYNAMEDVFRKFADAGFTGITMRRYHDIKVG